MSPGLSFLVLSTLFVIVGGLERIPALQFRPSGLVRPFMATDGAWYLVATTANLISTFVFRPQLSKLAIPAPADSIRGLPLMAKVVVAVVVYDFVAFAVHVGIHRSGLLWSVHKVHHSSLQLDGLATTRTHLFEHLLRNVPAQAALFALGMPASTVAVALVIYAAFALHGHSNLRVGSRWIELAFVTPRLHRLHHLPATTQNNFGTVLTIWDRLFGRLAVRDASPEERTGVPGEIDEYPQRFVAAFRQPTKEARARLSTTTAPWEELSDVDYFAGLPRDVLRRAARHADWVDVAAGTRLQRQGASPSWLWVAVDGPLELRRDGLLVGMLPVGAAYGEAELLLGAPVPDELVVQVRTTVVSLPARAFHGLLGDADFATAVARRQAFVVRASSPGGPPASVSRSCRR